MTDQLAKEVFDGLLEIIQRNGFTDIITFSIHPASDEQRFSKYNYDYKYNSTDRELQNLLTISQRPDRGSYEALRRITVAGREYFQKVNDIPNRYSKEINNLFGEFNREANISISMDMGNGQSVNLSESLATREVDQVMRLLTFIGDNMDKADDEFNSKLDEFLNKL